MRPTLVSSAIGSVSNYIARSQQRKLLPDIDHELGEFEYHKVRVFEIGEHVADATRLEALKLSRTATRWHVLYAKPRLVVRTGTPDVALRHVPVDVVLRLETSPSHIRPVEQNRAV